ncbi:MAG: CHAT domain-containing protein, partial [Rhodothermales bacterium]|nr:CHAT domain-containing protein [Rhodothermales bacterium]
PRTLCTVLIGSGEGGFGERASVRGLLYGLADALQGSAQDPCRITRVRIVELFKDKAERIHEQLRLLAAEAAANKLPIRFAVDDAVREGSGGRVSNEHRLAMLIAAATRAAHREPARKTRQHLDEFLDAARANDLDVAPEEIRTVLHELMAREADRQEREQARLEAPVEARLDAAALAQTLRLTFRPGLFDDGENDEEQDRTIRLTFRLQDGTYRVGALTYGDQGATLPEREIGVKEHTVRSLMRRMTAPSSDDVKRFGRLLYHTLVPREFREMLAHADQIIFEVDRDTAPIHWEMLMLGDDAVLQRLAGVDCRISRQLRSTYSAAPGLKRLRQGGLRALVIGDPGDPERGHHLANARREALAVEALFRKYGIETDVLVGAPTEGGYGPVPGKAPADYIEVFEKLINGRYEIVHYAGHGDYDAADPSRTGWLFKDDVLTAGEIERMEEPPALVFANACVSGRLSEAAHGGGRTTRPYGEAGLLPSVADEFFRRGVRNYIGTAWNVHDQGAIEFAENFYVLFLEQKLPICEAMQLARKAIRIHPRYGSLWAAYQHYGDPDFSVEDL